ncbi:hypothetical protein Hypma_007460 [Hypsizygus marmoreus]|uniref:Uncharacterized protein n=1 Tax=Hypsizygus marmoreus TaxID=39966 RepID=A0A369JSM6_HYPMA|nr:hypothetical protein Hypma_007460 [Hypsizygus marmoreus]
MARGSSTCCILPSLTVIDALTCSATNVLGDYRNSGFASAIGRCGESFIGVESELVDLRSNRAPNDSTIDRSTRRWCHSRQGCGTRPDILLFCAFAVYPTGARMAHSPPRCPSSVSASSDKAFWIRAGGVLELRCFPGVCPEIESSAARFRRTYHRYRCLCRSLDLKDGSVLSCKPSSFCAPASEIPATEWNGCHSQYANSFVSSQER